VLTLVPAKQIIFKTVLNYGCNLLRSGTMFLWIIIVLVVAVPGNQTIDVVSVRSIGPECLFIEKAFDAATGTDLVGVSLAADWPAHLVMPATA
jgi:hypothetical protein